MKKQTKKIKNYFNKQTKKYFDIKKKKHHKVAPPLINSVKKDSIEVSTASLSQDFEMIFLELLRSKIIRMLVVENLDIQKLKLKDIDQNTKRLSNNEVSRLFAETQRLLIGNYQNFQNYLYKDNCVIRRFLEFVVSKENWRKHDYYEEIKFYKREKLKEKHNELIELIQDKSTRLDKNIPIDEGFIRDLHKLECIRGLLINSSRSKKLIYGLGYRYEFESLYNLRLKVNMGLLSGMKQLIEKFWLHYQASDFDGEFNKGFDIGQHAKVIKYFFDKVITWKNYNEIFYPDGNMPTRKAYIYADINFFKILDNGNKEIPNWRTNDWSDKDIKKNSDFGGSIMPDEDKNFWDF